MKATYMWLARLIAIGVVLQAAFIAWGMFEIRNAADDGKAFTADTAVNAGRALHSAFGSGVIPLLVLLLLIVSFFARVPGGVRSALIILGLVVLQIGLAFSSYPLPVLGVLHGVNAFVLAGVAGFAGRQAAQAAPRSPEPEPSAAAA